MPAHRWGLALAAALAAAFFAPASGWASTSCPSGFAYAGFRSSAQVTGVRAVLTPLAPATAEEGRVAAWVGVGKASGRGKLGALRAGLLADAANGNRLFYEVRTRRGWRLYVGPEVEPGRRHRVSVLKVRARRSAWRVWLNGRPITRPLRLPGRAGPKPALATVETWSDRVDACSSFEYHFARVAEVRRGRAWSRLRAGRAVRTASYTVARQAPDTFVVKNNGKKKGHTQPAPEPAPEPVPAPDPSLELFAGDWESGGISPWSGLQHNQTAPVSAQFQLVTDPLAQGVYAARFTVRPGDKFGSSSGERAEVVWLDSDEGSGDVYWYAWSTLFPSGWTAPAGWGVVLQWHSGYPGVPPLVFNAREDTLLVDFNSGVLNTSGHGEYPDIHTVLPTLAKGLWNDFVLQVRWEGTRTGSFRLWHRVRGAGAFQERLNLTGIPTLQVVNGTAYENYLKLGLYRNADPVKTDVVFHDGFTRSNRAWNVGAAFAFDPGFVQLFESLG